MPVPHPEVRAGTRRYRRIGAETDPGLPEFGADPKAQDVVEPLNESLQAQEAGHKEVELMGAAIRVANSRPLTSSRRGYSCTTWRSTRVRDPCS